MNLPHYRCSSCKYGLVSKDKCTKDLEFTGSSFTNCKEFVHWNIGFPNFIPLSREETSLDQLGFILGVKDSKGGISKYHE